MKVQDLKELLQEKLDILEQYDDNDTINLTSNTYFLGHPNYFLGVAGYNGGYLNLDNLEEAIECDEEEEYEEEYEEEEDIDSIIELEGGINEEDIEGLMDEFDLQIEDVTYVYIEQAKRKNELYQGDKVFTVRGSRSEIIEFLDEVYLKPGDDREAFINDIETL